MFSPEKALQVLYPLEVADGHATCIGQDIRHNRNAAIIEDMVCLWRRRTIGSLNDQTGLDAGRIFLRYLILKSGRHQHITWQRQQFRVRDGLGIG